VIDGFSEALETDQADRLDDKGRSHLARDDGAGLEPATSTGCSSRFSVCTRGGVRRQRDRPGDGQAHHRSPRWTDLGERRRRGRRDLLLHAGRRGAGEGRASTEAGSLNQPLRAR
jgi:hypothetical protein